MKQASDAEPIVVKQKKEPIELTQEVLEQLWNGYKDSQPDNAKLIEAMSGVKFQLKDQNNFEILLGNIYKRDALEEFKVQILQHLREESGHDFLQWKLMVERQETEKVAYMPREKYEVMYRTNKNIQKLRELFPEIDF